jgi:hypothetical protein
MSHKHQSVAAKPLPPSLEPLALSIGQFCAMTSFKKTFVYAQIRSGRLPVRRRGGRTVILMQDAKRYLSGEPTTRAGGMARLGIVGQAARQLRMTAFHEAGHAVASWAMQRELGQHRCQFVRVFIRRPEDTMSPYMDYLGREVWGVGMVDGPSHYDPMGTHIPTFPLHRLDPETDMVVPVDDIEQKRWVGMRRRHMEAEVIALIAGPVAEARYTRQSQAWVMTFAGRHDYDMARMAAADFTSGEDLKNLIDTLWDRAAALIRRRDVWRAIGALAEELLEHWEIDGDQAIKIINSAAGWKPACRGEWGMSTPS